MSAYTASLILLVGLIAGFAAAWLLRGRDAARAASEIQRVESERVAAILRCDSLLRELQEEKVARAAAASASEVEQREHEKKIAELTTLRGEIETRIKGLATEALQNNQASFLLLAGQAFDTHKQAAATLLDQKEQAITALLNPVAVALDAYQKGLGGFERAHAVLASEVEKYGTQAQKLVNALQSSPQVPGRWGEKQLENVIELAGLTDHIDYISQQTIQGEDGRLRPDLVIRLPGERSLVVDVKTPLRAYLDAHQASDDEARESHLRRHAQQVRAHMKQLATKRYWEALRPVTPDFVVMFIPGENFYRAALERDPELQEDGWKDRVLVASPTTLIGLARTIAFDWRREKVAENAKKVHELGGVLYNRLATMGDHISKLGNSIKLTVEHYSRFVGSLEASVMPKAREIHGLEVEGAQEPLPELKPVEILPRELRGGGDLLLTAEIIPVVSAVPPSAAE